jgi:aspartate-semialdehyde dehydrogenase
VSSTAVRVPVFVAHSEAVHVETHDPITPDRARTLLSAVPGVVVQDDPATSTYPLATQAAGTDEIYVGRVRQDESIDGGRGLALWVVSDNLRKVAATNAVQLAEILVDRGWVRAAATRTAAGTPA